MTIEFVEINSLDEIDYDYLFAESYSRMENTYLWPHAYSTLEQRKEYYYTRLVDASNGIWDTKNEDDTFVMVVTKLDGAIVEFIAGFKDADGFLTFDWHLTAPDENGKRNWIYTPEAIQARKDFVVANGIAGFKETTWVGSLQYKTVKMRAETGNFLLEEKITHKLNIGTRIVDIVEFTITFP